MQLKKAERRFKLTTRDYAQLAAFRHAMRGFMRFSEEAAAEAGLTTEALSGHAGPARLPG